MLFTKMLLTLSDEQNHTTEIEFQIRKTLSAQLWAKSIQASQAEGLRETNRFYNFPGHLKSDLNYSLKKLTDLIQTLKSFHPELEFPQIDYSNLQESINNLHHKFAHSHHVTKKINEMNAKPWGDFNNLLHNIEAILSNQRALEQSDLNNSRIVFTWNNSNPVMIPDECYSDFSVRYEFGAVYANYSQVGRHMYEIFRSKDDQLDDEHIQPFRFLSADTNIWLGSTTGHGFEKTVLTQMKDWFEERKEKFNRLGYFWGDPKLAIGQIAVARLSEPLISIKESHNFVEKLSAYSKVVSVKVS